MMETMSEDLTQEDLHHTADRLVDELLAAAGVARPPVDAIDLARRHFGMTVREDERPGPRGRPRRGAADVIPVSHESNPEARQWAAAQAIGERLKPDLMRRLGLDPAARLGLTNESFSG